MDCLMQIPDEPPKACPVASAASVCPSANLLELSRGWLGRADCVTPQRRRLETLTHSHTHSGGNPAGGRSAGGSSAGRSPAGGKVVYGS